MSFSLFWQVVRLSLTAGWMILVLLAPAAEKGTPPLFLFAVGAGCHSAGAPLLL